MSIKIWFVKVLEEVAWANGASNNEVFNITNGFKF